MKLSNNKSILLYSIISIVLASIICFIAFTINNINISILSILTPTTAAIFLTYYSEGKKGLKQLLVKQTVKKISLKWVLLSLLGIPFFAVLAMLTQLQFNFSEFSLRTTQLLPQVIVIVLIAVGEEYGWRGYLLPKLMTKYNVLNSGIITGVIWGVWHLPAYFIGTGTPLEMPFFVFMIWVVLGSLFMSWLYYYTHSVLLAIFVHISANAAFNYLLILPEFTGSMINFYMFMAYTFVFVTLVYLLKKKDLLNKNSENERKTKTRIYSTLFLNNISMKKRSKKIIIFVLLIIGLVSICAYKFDEDSAKFFKIRNAISANGGSYFTTKHENTNEFTNPLIKAYFFYYKIKFKKRFIEQTEVFNDDTESIALKNIMNLYRDYWIQDFMKSDEDTVSYNRLFVKKMNAYLVEQGLSKTPTDSVLKFADIRKDLKSAIEAEGAFCETFNLNEKLDIIIWTSQKEELYTVETPYETRKIPVVFFTNRILKNRANFISFGTKKTGGWPNNKEGVIYSGDYDVASEQFKYSFLTHEANHFFDIEKFPNLSAADLEYRSKLIELIYVKNDVNRMLREFLSGASNKNRNYGHAYANFKVIENLSKIIFNKPFEGNYNAWKKIDVAVINNAATKLFEANQKKLEANPKADMVI